MNENVGWARVWPVVKAGHSRSLRRGAWYPVLEDHPSKDVTLAVDDRRVAVPRRLLEIRTTKPERFTIVRLFRTDPNPVRGTSRDLGRSYAVCPTDGERLRVWGEPNQLTCRTCGHHAEIAWWETE